MSEQAKRDRAFISFSQRRVRARLATILLATGFLALVIGGAITQNMWRPHLDAYWRYARLANSTEALMAGAPGAVFQDCREGSADCPVMVVIPSGAFLMGSPEGGAYSEDIGHFYSYERPQREISVAGFAVSQHEITFANWNACAAAGGCEFLRDRFDREDGDLPATDVSWADVQQYVTWLSRVTGHEYRLLSEAEWEYTARAGSLAQYSWGDDPPICDGTAPNGAAFGFGEGSCQQQSAFNVGSFRANAFGLFDMHGNVSEWVEDCYAPYEEARRDSSPVRPIAAAGEPKASKTCLRVVRGGAWSSDAPPLRAAYRDGQMPTQRYETFGFRVARTISRRES